MQDGRHKMQDKKRKAYEKNYTFRLPINYSA